MIKRVSKKSGLFREQEEVYRRELRELFKEDSGIIPGTGERFTREERMNLLEKVFPRKKYFGKIKKWQAKKAILTLQSRMFQAKDEQKRQELEKKVKYLKKITGI